MSSNGVTLSESTALKFEKASNQVLNDRGVETKQLDEEPRRRSGRFYRTPANGVSAPSSATEPSSASCIKMIFNGSGTELEATTSEETIYFRRAMPGSRIVEVMTIAGKQFAIAPAVANGIIRGLAQTSFLTTAATVDVQISFSNVANVNVGDIVTAVNFLNRSGDDNAPCYVYAHGDESETFDLLDVECPA